MANMSHCRFQNTYQDLKDCIESIDRTDIKDLPEIEKKYALKLRELCEEYLELSEAEEIVALINWGGKCLKKF